MKDKKKLRFVDFISGMFGDLGAHICNGDAEKMDPI